MFRVLQNHVTYLNDVKPCISIVHQSRRRELSIRDTNVKIKEFPFLNIFFL